MRYDNIKKAEFIKRNNRFVATCLVDGKEEKVHVKNTGRLGELFVKGANALLSRSSNPDRKTAYDLIMIEKNGRMFNVDSQMPNHLFREAFENSAVRLEGYTPEECSISAEKTYGQSRFDFLIEGESKRAYVEVKGVNLEVDGAALFPDGVSKRALKHINELRDARRSGFDAFIVFVVQFEGASYFSVNEGHEYLREALRAAESEGVGIIACSTRVENGQIGIDGQLEVRL